MMTAPNDKPHILITDLSDAIINLGNDENYQKKCQFLKSYELFLYHFENKYELIKEGYLNIEFKTSIIENLLKVINVLFTNISTLSKQQKTFIYYDKNEKNDTEAIDIITITAIFNILKIFVREKEACENTLISLPFFEKLIEIIAVIVDLEFYEFSEGYINFCYSIFSLLSNILYYKPSFSTILNAESSLLIRLIHFLKYISTVKEFEIRKKYVFVIIRLLFYATTVLEATDFIHKENLFEVIIDSFLYFLPIPKMEVDKNITDLLSEYLKLFFNLTLPESIFIVSLHEQSIKYQKEQSSDTLSAKSTLVKDKSTQSKCFSALLQIIDPMSYLDNEPMNKIDLCLRKSCNQTLLDLQGFAMEVIFHFPIPFQLAYFKKNYSCNELTDCPSENFHSKTILESNSKNTGIGSRVIRYSTDDFPYPIVAWVLEFLHNFIDFYIDDPVLETKWDFIVVPVLYLTSLCELDALVRRSLRRALLPSLIDRSNRSKYSPYLKDHLVRLIVSSDQWIKESIENFFYILCQKNVYRMVYHTGFGNAAGLLLRIGKLFPEKSKISEEDNNSVDESVSSDEEFIKETNPSIMTTFKDEYISGMMRNEQNKHALSTDELNLQEDYLCELMERLEKNGMIRIMRDGDNNTSTAISGLENKNRH